MASEFLCHTEPWQESQKAFLRGKGNTGGTQILLPLEINPKYRNSYERSTKNTSWWADLEPSHLPSGCLPPAATKGKQDQQ